MCGLLLGIVGLCKAAGRVFQAIASAFELDEHAAVHETVQDGGGEGGVAQVVGPVVNDAVRGDEGAASKFVALVQERLQFVSAFRGDLSCQE